ncbi:MAG: tellurite resistance TerB family protein [Candidatus Cloacimonadia bacterium]
MEIIIVIIIGFYIYHIVNNSKKRVFAIDCTETKEQLDDAESTSHQKINILNLKIRGMIQVPIPNYPVVFIVSLFDSTEETKPVLTTINAFQMKESMAFLYVSDPDVIPHQQSIFKEWVDFLKIPTDGLIFPKKGPRKLQIDLDVRSAIDFEKIIARASQVLNVENRNAGYEDFVENREKIKSLMIQLAVAVSAIDGELAHAETTVISEWIDKTELAKDGNENEAIKKRLRTVLTNLQNRVREGNEIGIEGTCQEILEISHPAEKYEAIELALKVVNADDFAAEKEIRLLERLAKALQLDPKRFRKLMEKHLPLEMHEKVDRDVILNIQEGMTREQKKKHLREEYVKWNSRVTNPNPVIRKQAEDMLQLIAEARKDLG